MEGIAFHAKSIQPNQAKLELTIQSLKLPKPWDGIHFFKIRCADFEYSDNRINCSQGKANLKSDWLTQNNIPFAFSSNDQSIRLTLSKIKALQGIVSLVLKQNKPSGHWSLEINGNNVALASAKPWLSNDVLEDMNGKLNLYVQATGKGDQVKDIEAKITSPGLSIQSSDQKIITEQLRLAAQVTIRQTKGQYHWKGKVKLDNGALYVDPVYLELQQPIQIDIEGAWKYVTKQLLVDQLVIEQPSIFHLEAQALTTLAEKPTLDTLIFNLQTSQLAEFYNRYLAPFTVASAAEGIELAGKLKLAGTIENQALVRIDADFSGLNIVDQQSRIGLEQGSGQLHWNKSEQKSELSQLSWQTLHLFKIPVGPATIPLQLKAKQIILVEAVAIPLLQGKVNIDRFDLKLRHDEKPDVHFIGGIENVSLEQLTTALDLAPLTGELTGSIPGVRYVGDKLSIDGALKIDVFEGVITLTDLKLAGIFSNLPQFFTSIEITDLDLQSMTKTFEIGGIEGKLSGFVRELYMENWQPITFYAWLGTPDDDRSKHSISQKAVNNLASVGGGGVTDVLSRSFLRFFETFNYRKMGFGCYLHNGVCQVMGAEPVDDGYYIIKGGGVPRIDVIGYNPQVDWNVLIQRLGRITQTDEAVVE